MRLGWKIRWRRSNNLGEGWENCRKHEFSDVVLIVFMRLKQKLDLFEGNVKSSGFLIFSGFLRVANWSKNICLKSFLAVFSGVRRLLSWFSREVLKIHPTFFCCLEF